MIAGVNPKSKVSVISESVVRDVGLPILDLNTLIGSVSSIEIEIPYLGYTEIKLNILQMGHYDQDVLMMIHPDNQCKREWSIELGSQHLTREIGCCS